MKNKKGEMTSGMIVIFVLAMVGFVIILLVYGQLNWTGNVDREVCHESVIFRGTLPDKMFFEGKELIPLKCKTEKICVTSKTFGKGDCKKELGENYVTMRVSSNEEKQSDEIKVLLAREIADCWNTMGEGKLQVFTREWAEKRTCAVCSRIDFDDTIDVKEIDGFVRYLYSHKVPNKEVSYIDFLTPNQNLGISKIIAQKDKLDLKEPKAIVFVEMTRGEWGKWLGGGVVGIAGAKGGAMVGSVFGPGGTIAGGAIGLVGGFAVGSVTTGNYVGNDYYSGYVLTDYSEEGLKGLECSSMESLS